MNSAKTFAQHIGQKKTVIPPSINPSPNQNEKSSSNPNPNANPRIDENERVFTFNIRTIQNHIKNDCFSSIFTIFEVFVRVHKVVELPKATKFTLRDLDNINTMEAVCYQTGLNIRNGDAVRCVGNLNKQTGQLKIQTIRTINFGEEMTMIKRLEAISGFALTKSPIKMK